PDPEQGILDESYRFVVRGKRVRWPIAMGNAYRIYDRDERAFFTVYPSEQLVAVAREEAIAPGDAGAGQWTMTPAEPGGRVLSEACDGVKITGPNGVSFDACVAQGFPALPLSLMSPVLAGALPFDAMLIERGVFPLASIGHATGAKGSTDAGPDKKGGRA